MGITFLDVDSNLEVENQLLYDTMVVLSFTTTTPPTFTSNARYLYELEKLFMLNVNLSDLPASTALSSVTFALIIILLERKSFLMTYDFKNRRSIIAEWVPITKTLAREQSRL